MTWLALEEVATELRIEPATLLRLTRKGDGPPLVKVTRGIYRIRRTDLEEWLVRRRVLSDGESLAMRQEQRRPDFWGG